MLDIILSFQSVFLYEEFFIVPQEKQTMIVFTADYSPDKMAASTNDKRMPITHIPTQVPLVLRLLKSLVISHWTLPLREEEED
jgi:hypothetical protein